MTNSLSGTGLSSNTIQKISQVFSQYPQIESVSLYGSRAKGNFKNGSDIDLTIKSESLSSSQLIKIENELDDLMLPYKIDLSLFREIENISLVEHIQRVSLELYRKTE